MSRYIFTILFLASVLTLTAQTHIKNVVSQITNSNSVTSIIYSEERCQTDKKLSQERQLITYSDSKFNQMVYDAMKKDRPDAVGYHEVVSPGSSAIYKIEFKNGRKSTVYTLLLPGNSISIETDYK